MNPYTFFWGRLYYKLLWQILSGLLFVFSQNVFSHRIICPACCKTTKIPEDFFQSETYLCAHCHPPVFIPVILPSSQGSNILLDFGFGASGEPSIQPAFPESTPATRELPIPGTNALSAAAQITSSLDISLELANILRSTDNNQNLVFSPAAMTSLLTLLAVSAGLLNDSNLALQANRARTPDRGLALEVPGASGYREQSWFLARNRRSFSSSFRYPQLNPDLQTSRFDPDGLAAADRINQQIREFIQQGLPDNSSRANASPWLTFSDATELMAITVATFSQHWRDRFDRDTMNFTTRSGQAVQVPSMRSATTIDVSYSQDESGWQVVILPYARGGDRMILLVPPSTAMPAPIPHLSPERIRQLVSSARDTYIRLTMPNFFTMGNHELHMALPNSSLQWMVSPGSFSGDLTSPPIGVHSIESRQIITFESDERGSRALAFMQTEIKEAYIPPEINILIDRPFTALVVNSEGLVCFYMEVNNPGRQ